MQGGLWKWNSNILWAFVDWSKWLWYGGQNIPPYFCSSSFARAAAIVKHRTNSFIFDYRPVDLWYEQTLCMKWWNIRLNSDVFYASLLGYENMSFAELYRARSSVSSISSRARDTLLPWRRYKSYNSTIPFQYESAVNEGSSVEGPPNAAIALHPFASFLFPRSVLTHAWWHVSKWPNKTCDVLEKTDW